MKKNLLAITLFSVMLVVASPGWADSKKDSSAELISNEGKILEEVVLLGDEITNLRDTITPIQAALDNARNNLKKISIASTAARGYNKQIRQLEPQLKTYKEQLQKKLGEMNNKMSELNVLKTELQWVQNDMTRSLFRTASRWVDPSQEQP